MNEQDRMINRGMALQAAMRMLSEHFDCGMIAVTYMKNGNTFAKGGKWGNEFAISGMQEKISHIISGPEEPKLEPSDT